RLGLLRRQRRGQPRRRRGRAGSVARAAVLGDADPAAARRRLAGTGVTGVRRLGAVPVGDGTVGVCVWAPGAEAVSVRSDEPVVPRLRGLRELGVTAIEVMPVATFPGERGWGYDGLYTYAVHPAYGGPHGLGRLVDAAHAEGLGVILDVVYNHVGPGDEALRAFGPYFTDRNETFWGKAIDYGLRPVREWAIENA